MRPLMPPILTLILLISFSSSFGQDFFFNWAKKLNYGASGYGTGVVLIGVDGAQNVYLSGSFRNTLDLDPGPANYDVTSWLDHAFVIKLDPQGNFIWGKEFGGTRYTLPESMFVDQAGNVYLTGMFSDTVDFDPGAGEFKLVAKPTSGTENLDVFVEKLNTNGEFQWAKAMGNLDVDQGQGIDVDKNGNVFVTGSITGTVDFNTGGAAVLLGLNGVVNTFIAQYSPAGALIWAKELSGTYHSFSRCLRVDRKGNIYTSGIFNSTVDFDPGPGVFKLNSVTDAAFMVKLDPAGNFLWAKKDVAGEQFDVDDQENIITYNTSASNGVLSKYDIKGDQVWTKSIGGRPLPWVTSSRCVRLDASGNIFLSGHYYYTQDFDPGPGTYNMTAVSGLSYVPDNFVLRLDANGNFVWAKSFGGWGEEGVHCLAVDASGNIYTTGTFYGFSDFDPGPGEYTLAASGTSIFVQKLSSCAHITFSSIDVTACNNYTLNNITYTQSGTYTQSLPNSFGCDSLITLNLSLQNTRTELSARACDRYAWNNRILTTSGIYIDSLKNSNGCDSIVVLDLSIKNSISTTVNKQICEGQSFEGYTKAGTYINSFTAANGCDSVRTLNLKVISKKSITINYTICQGQSYQGHKSAGTYIETFTSSEGCDSIRTLNLVVHPVYEYEISPTICKGQSFLGHTEPGTYKDTLHTQLGCDSIIIIHLKIMDKPVSTLPKDTSFCPGDSLLLYAGKAASYLWQNNYTQDHITVKTPGVYSVTLFNSCGNTFDQVIVTNLNCTTEFPTAFTPNNDGKNEQFKILNPYSIKDFHLTVYNRWGQPVFESHNASTGWDGTLAGRPQDPGVFIWHCSYVKENLRYDKKGTVTLIR